MWEQNEEIQLFREYLRIPSVHPNVNYDPCVEYLKRQATQLTLPIYVYYPSGNASKPFVIITWLGNKPSLPSIILNSHMDVVPVFEENWKYPPFGADIDADGRIFARGSQDMKCVGVQYLAAIRALRKEGKTLRRTIHVTFVPDEETGGIEGMKAFLLTEEFKQLNVGFSLDEGIASPTDVYPVFYAERPCWYIQFNCTGTAGHGSLLHKNTAAEKLNSVLNKALEYRNTQVQKLIDNPELTIGDVTTINLTMIEGGIQENVVPPMMKITFDARLAIAVKHEDFEKMVKRWGTEAGDGVECTFIHKGPWIKPSDIGDSNQFWVAFKSAIDDLQLKIKTQVFPGGTDSRYIRQAGIPAIGFSPIDNTPVLLHDNDEYLKADTYLKGIEIYKKLIEKIANVQ